MLPRQHPRSQHMGSASFEVPCAAAVLEHIAARGHRQGDKAPLEGETPGRQAIGHRLAVHIAGPGGRGLYSVRETTESDVVAFAQYQDQLGERRLLTVLGKGKVPTEGYLIYEIAMKAMNVMESAGDAYTPGEAKLRLSGAQYCAGEGDPLKDRWECLRRQA